MNTMKIAVFFIFGMLLFTQCEKIEPISENPQILNEGDHSKFDLSALEEKIASMPFENLSEDEIAGIMLMREEEKLARDIYNALHSALGMHIFENIAKSEQTHTDAVAILISKYELDDPFIAGQDGVFQSESLQSLYDSLIIVGKSSIISALDVGASVEEIDILDLMVQIETVIDNEDVNYIYKNLLAASRNHLRAFVKKINAEGVNYTPKYLSESVYNDIVNSEMEHGWNG